jgi:hypothetical protein
MEGSTAAAKYFRTAQVALVIKIERTVATISRFSDI